MRVYHIDRQRSWTGQVAQGFNVIAGLLERGHEAAIIAHPGSKFAERARERGIEVLEYPMRGWRSYASALRIGWALRRRKVDIVHCHGSWDHNIAVIAAAIGGVPHVVRSKHNHTRLHSGALSRFMYRRVSRVVAITDFVREQLIEDGLSPSHVVKISDAIDVERFAPRPRDPDLARELGISPDDLVVGTVSSLHDRKGIEEILRAFAVLRNAPFAPRLKCVLLGKNWEKWTGLAQELGVSDRVIFPGFSEDVGAVAALFHVFVHPSREEALGSAVLEAMAGGLALVVSDAGGLPEIVTEDVGIRVPARDPAALAGAVRELLDDPERRASMGKAGRRRAVEHFSIEAFVDRHIELYRKLLERTANVAANLRPS